MLEQRWLQGISRWCFVAIACLVDGLAQQANSPPPNSLLASDTLVIRGRLVDAASGEPLSRGRVKLTGHQSTGYDLAWGVGDWVDPPEQTTGADGRFEFVLRLAAPFELVDRARYHLAVVHPQHLAAFVHGTFGAGRRTGLLDHGDLPLPTGVRPRIRCVDTEGVRQPGVVLNVRPLDSRSQLLRGPDGTQGWIQGGGYGSTDIDGQLHLDHPLPAGEYQVEVRGRQAAEPPRTFALPSADVLEVRVAKQRPELVIEGTLVDAAGLPVAGATLAAGGEHGVATVTRRDGRFTLVHDGKTPATTVTIELARNRRHDAWRRLTAVAWGTHDLRIELPPVVTTSFVVTDDAGRAFESFSLYCLPVPSNAAPAAFRIAGTFADGRVAAALEPGQYLLQVVPHSDRLAPTAWQRITVGDASAEVGVSLAAAILCEVELVVPGAAADVAAGTLVEVIAGGAPSPTEFVRPYTAAVARDGDGPMVVASARADASGRVRLRVPDLGDLHLRCRGGRVQPRVLAAELRADRPQRIELARGGRLRGSVGTIADLERLDPDLAKHPLGSIYSHTSWTRPTLTLRFANGAPPREAVTIERDGSFVADGLPPGEVAIELRLWQRDGDRRVLVPLPPVLGTFAIDADTDRVVELRVPGRRD